MPFHRPSYDFEMYAKLTMLFSLKKLFVHTSSFPIYLLIAFLHFTPYSFTQTSFCAIFVFVPWGNGGSLLRKRLRRHAIERFVRRVGAR